MATPITLPHPIATPAQGVSPVQESERIVPLDVLRGFALLGILAMNIQAFSMPLAAYLNPTAYGDLHGANWGVWYLCHIFADEKFMTIFSMLFGAGIFLMTQNVEQRGQRPARLHYRRMGWLMLFGLLHGFLLWFGDILYDYGLCGMIAYLFRKSTPRRLLIIGASTVCVAFLLSYGSYKSIPYWPANQVEAMRVEMWQPTPQIEARMLADYRGNWLSEMKERVPATIESKLQGFLFFTLWRATGMMLVGMAMFKLGVFSAKRFFATYLAMIAVAVFVGIPLIVYGVHREITAGWEFTYSFFIADYYNYFGSIAVCFGWVAAVMLACKSPWASKHLWPLAAVGRMAFSNYILQTLICTTIFYGHGFGLFGKVPRTQQFEIVLAIWVLQLIISPLWLRRFQYGPLEWLWRSLTYLRPQPFLRATE